MGETEMPLSVYESPLMYYYRKYRAMRKNDNSDGYYVVQKRRITSSNNQNTRPPLPTSIQGSIDNFVQNDSYEEYNDNEVMLLYGRGPVFEMHDEYSDRFDGFDD
jgi:hypothetical protein